MSEKPDSMKIDAALKRAAYKAVHGTREERSGRFTPDSHRQGMRIEGYRPPQSAKRLEQGGRHSDHKIKGG